MHPKQPDAKRGAHITDTYWYLTATPELLRQALFRVEPSEREALP